MPEPIDDQQPPAHDDAVAGHDDEVFPDEVGTESPDVAGEGDQPPVDLTGHEAVDEVLASLDTLRDLPIEEHVQVFDAAHEGLRRALSAAGETRPPASS